MTATHPRKTPPQRAARPSSDLERRGAKAIVEGYRRLAQSHGHLFEPILRGAPPTQWEHYPPDDAISRDRRYQWYYHSHTPADRPGSMEHGHFHLFARMDGAARAVDTGTEKKFLRRLAAVDSKAATRHLLCVGMSSVGAPISLFTVNRWVTGDLLLSRASSLTLLESTELETGYSMIDAVLRALCQLYRTDIRSLMTRRDARLRARAVGCPGTLDDTGVEVLLELTLDVDRRIATAFANSFHRVGTVTSWRRRS